MRLTPSTIDDLQKALAKANAAKSRIDGIDLSAVNRVLEHTPEDMTVTVQGGATLANLQTEIKKRGQWLPIDPPDSSITIQQLLATNASGPRRFGYGTVRDYVIGLTIAMADGRLIHSGGKVVKNVAGYDLMKLFIGDQGTLGIVVEVTFKLRPVPEAECFFRKVCLFPEHTTNPSEDGEKAIEAILSSPLTPIVLDAEFGVTDNDLWIVVGFDGTKQEVGWQSAKAAELGFVQSTTLEYDREFRCDSNMYKHVRKTSVLPSKLFDYLGQCELFCTPFVSRAGNGIIYYDDTDPLAQQPSTPKHLNQRIKDTFDPNHIFPSLP